MYLLNIYPTIYHHFFISDHLFRPKGQFYFNPIHVHPILFLIIIH